MDSNALIYAYCLDGTLKGQPIAAEDVAAKRFPAGRIWLHFDYTHTDTLDWFSGFDLIDPAARESILSDETRPRTTEFDSGIVVTLRGVNLNPGSNPEDMVSIRIWANERFVISTRKRHLLSAQETVKDIEALDGPEHCGELISIIADRLTRRMQTVIYDIEEHVTEIEEIALTGKANNLRAQLADLRRQAIALKRYLKPQHEALEALQNPKIKLFSHEDRIALRETTNHLTRYLEELDSVRDRAAVTQEELAGVVSEELNSRMYILSIVAALFLPLGFLTGLLGINVGGIPGADNQDAFIWFCLIMGILVALQVYIFRRKRWL